MYINSGFPPHSTVSPQELSASMPTNGAQSFPGMVAGPQPQMVQRMSAGVGQQNIVSVVLGFALEVINTLVALISQFVGGGAAIAPQAGLSTGAGDGGQGGKSSGSSFSGFIQKAGDFIGGLFGSGSESKSSASNGSGKTGGGFLDTVLGLFGGGSSAGSGSGFLGKVGSFIGSFF